VLHVLQFLQQAFVRSKNTDHVVF